MKKKRGKTTYDKVKIKTHTHTHEHKNLNNFLRDKKSEMRTKTYTLDSFPFIFRCSMCTYVFFFHHSSEYTYFDMEKKFFNQTKRFYKFQIVYISSAKSIKLSTPNPTPQEHTPSTYITA